MSLIVRIDVDRPYGKHPLHRHLLSRLASDFWFPKVPACGYLTELAQTLTLLNERNARAHVFFRRCTLPSPDILQLIAQGRHEIGLHLEDSSSRDSLLAEKGLLERHIGRPVSSFSKHGSGGAKYGRRHHAPYEPENYIRWAEDSGLRVFLGNLEDPTILPTRHGGNLLFHPSAFWLEPHWRDTNRFTVDWLLTHAAERDIVLLIHPENVLESRELTESLTRLCSRLETKILT